jgi:hypothetical protein
MRCELERSETLGREEGDESEAKLKGTISALPSVAWRGTVFPPADVMLPSILLTFNPYVGAYILHPSTCSFTMPRSKIFGKGTFCSVDEVHFVSL